MPIVQALCLNDAYDSTACIYYDKGRTYELDTESPIAHLTSQPMSSGRMNKDGEIVAAKLTRTPLPCFQWDRAAPLGATGNGRPSDYTCDECGKRCKSLNELGTHVHVEHPKQALVDDSDEEVIIKQKHTCKQCEPHQTFDSRGDLMRHKGQAHNAAFFRKGFSKQEVEAEPTPA